MVPPGKVKPSGSTPPPSRSPSEEITDLLTGKNLVGDARWQDSAFRRKHMKLYFALDAIEGFMKGEIGEAKLKEKINAWLTNPDFASQANKAFYESVQKNIHRTLKLFQTPANVAKVKVMVSLIPGKEPEPKPVKVSAPKPIADPTDPKNWDVNFFGINIHAFDEAFRRVPHILTLKAFPEAGYGQNQSSKFGINAHLQYSFQGYDFFTGFLHEDFNPTGSAGIFNRMAFYGGLWQYGGDTSFTKGRRGPGGGWHFGINNKSWTGFGLGAAWCSSVKDSNISGAECSFFSPQLSIINGSELLSAGYGPIEVGVSFAPSTTFINFGTLGAPNGNRVPFVWSINYYFRDPKGRGNSLKPEDVVREDITNPEITYTAMKIVQNSFSKNLDRKNEAAFQMSAISALNADQYRLANTGRFAFGILTGFGEGQLAYTIGRHLHLADADKKMGLGLLNQKVTLPILMGLELIAHGIGWAGTAGTPKKIETSMGEPLPPDFNPSVNEGIWDLQGRSYRLNVPQILIRDALAVAGMFQPFGDRNEAIKKGGMVNGYVGKHAALALAGAALILTSGDGSGSGTLGSSILGNRPPADGELVSADEGRLSLGSQANQSLRLGLGSQLVGYAASGILDYYLGRLQYSDLKDRKGETGKGSKGNSQSSLLQSPHLSFQMGPSGAQLMFSGKW